MIQLTYENRCAVVAPEYGMNSYSVRIGERELLRRAPSVEVYAENPTIYGIPTLIPPNRTDHGVFTYGGKTYDLGINTPAEEMNFIHGTLQKMPFTLTSQTENSVEGVFENDGSIFPFPFRVTVRAELNGEGYHLQYRICNTGTETMPLTFALHANFNEPSRFSVGLGKRWEVNARHIPTGKMLELTEREYGFTQGAAPEGVISGFYEAAGHTAMLDDVTWKVSENFNQWITWNGGGGKHFLSLEPQCGAVNALNNGFGRIDLPVGKEEIFTAELLI